MIKVIKGQWKNNLKASFNWIIPLKGPITITSIASNGEMKIYKTPLYNEVIRTINYVKKNNYDIIIIPDQYTNEEWFILIKKLVGEKNDYQ